MSQEEHLVVGDRYELLERIGSGGQAEVWLAADRRLNGKRVAVKRLLGFRPGGVAAPMDLERARREAFAASRLDHPNLVAVTDFVAEDGEPFIVMEYVAGPTLEDAVSSGGMPVPDAARLIGQIAGALAEAHEAGIVHRDIKPANILVDARGTAKLTDFGIARATGDARFTQTGMFTGTVAYLAPELLDGSEALAASDIWSLGATLFELAEGRKAFAGPTVPALLNAIVQGPLPVPERARDLAPLLSRMLDRRPQLRPGATEVAALLAAAPYTDATPTQPTHHRHDNDPTVAGVDLRTFAADPGDQTGGATAPEPATPRRRRTRLVAVVAAVVVAAAVAVGVVALGGGDPAAKPSGRPAAGADTDGGTYAIGMTGNFSGSDEPSTLKAVRLAVERANATGGALRFTIVTENDAGTTAGPATAAAKLVAMPKVMGVITPNPSSVVTRVGATYSKAGLSYLTPVASFTALGRAEFRTLHQSIANDRAVALAAGQYLARSRAGPVLVVDDGSAYGGEASGAAQEALSDAGVENERIVATPESDHTPVAERAEKVDAGAVFYGGIDAGAARLAKALLRVGFRGLRVGVEGAGSAKFIRAAGTAAAKGWSFAVPYADPADAAATTFAAAYEKRFGAPPLPYSAEAFDTANALIAAIRDADRDGAVTRDRVERALDTTTYAGVLTKVAFEPSGVAKYPQVWRYQVTDGALVGRGAISS